MKLREYLFRNRITQGQMGEMTGRKRSHISQISNEKNIPSMKTAVAIEAATNGEVKWQDIYEPFAEIERQKLKGVE